MQMNKKFLKMLIAIGAMACAACTAAVVGGVVAAGGAGAATATDTRGSDTVVDDQSLEHKVNDVLGAEVPGGSFTVASYAQQVLLAGQVPSADAKAKAEAAAANTVGVRRVFNYLSVGPNEDAGAISEDAYLTSAAKTRLIAQKGVNTNNIKVVTSHKIVYLLGRNAGKPHQIRAAITGIKGLSGVRGVVNLIGQ
jgi:osmotically-inducible protein OsmY